jgi:hypothetical protein
MSALLNEMFAPWPRNDFEVDIVADNQLCWRFRLIDRRSSRARKGGREESRS